MALVCTAIAALATNTMGVVADTDVDAVAGNGVYGGITPPIPPITALPAGFLQTGFFSYQGTCVAEVSSDDLPYVPVLACSASSSGTYLNVVCGTGTLTGALTLELTIPDSVNPEVVRMNYTAVVVAGAGVIAVTSPVAGIGVLNLVAYNASSGACLTQDVVFFNATTALSLLG